MSDPGRYMVVRTDRPQPAGSRLWVADYGSDADSWVAAASYCITAVVRHPTPAGELARQLLAALPGMLAIPHNADAIADIFGPVGIAGSGVERLLTQIGDGTYEQERVHQPAAGQATEARPDQAQGF